VGLQLYSDRGGSNGREAVGGKGGRSGPGRPVRTAGIDAAGGFRGNLAAEGFVQGKFWVTRCRLRLGRIRPCGCLRLGFVTCFNRDAAR
jgi:hypothetical protein